MLSRVPHSPSLAFALFLLGAAITGLAVATGHDVLFGGLAASAWAATAVRAWQWRAHHRDGHALLAANLHRAFALHPSPVYFLDRQRRFVNLNDQALAQFGLSRKALIGRSALSLLAPEHRETAARLWEEVLAGQAVSYQAVVMLPDGERYDANVVLVPMVAEGDLAGVLGMVENIRERVLHEQQLHRSRQMLQTIIDNLPLKVFWKDTERRLQGCNDRFAGYLGLERASMVGRTDAELHAAGAAIAADMVGHYEQEDRQVLESGVPLVGAEVEVTRVDGSKFWTRTSKIPLRSPSGDIVALLCVAEDITERKHHELRLQELATHDSLTGLANRRYLLQRIEAAIARHGPGEVAVIYFDIDRFKSINDTWGHEVGDRVIRLFARRVLRVVRDTDLVGRMGGDEFVLVTTDTRPEAVAGLCDRLSDAVRRPMRLGNDLMVRVSTSLGVAAQRPGETVEQLLRRADAGMYRAKQHGRDRAHFADA